MERNAQEQDLCKISLLTIESESSNEIFFIEKQKVFILCWEQSIVKVVDVHIWQRLSQNV